MPWMSRTLKNVQLFQVGNHKDMPWDEADLDALARNFTVCKDLFKPQIVIGHEAKMSAFGDTGRPAFGQPTRIAKEYVDVDGKPMATLVGDFEDVPDSLAALIHAGTYRRISPEIYHATPTSLVDKGVKGPVMRSVAILGGAVPEIKTLEALNKFVSEPASAVAFSDDQPRRRIRFVEKVIDEATNTVSVFSEVESMDTPSKKLAKSLADCSDLTRAGLKKFSDTPEGEKPPLGRDELIAIIGDAGNDTSVITDAVSDELLMEWARGSRMKLEEEAAAEAKKTVEAADQAAAQAQAEADKPKETTAQPSGAADGDKPAEKKKTEPETAIAMSDDTAIAAMEKRIIEFFDEKLALTFSEAGASAKAQRDELAKQTDEARRASVILFCDDLVRAGKMFPAEIDGGIVDCMLQLDAATVYKFADGKEATPFDRFKTMLAGRPKLMEFSDRVKAKHDQGDAEDTKVLCFAESHPDAIKKSFNRTPEGYVQLFHEAKKLNPSLTAAEFTGSAA